MSRPSALALVALFAGLIVSDLAMAAHVFSGVDLRTGQEQTILRDDPKSRGTVVVFVSSKCPCSMSHVTELKALAADFPEFRFVGVNSNGDETLDASRTYFESLGLTFPILRDVNSTLADEFKAVKTPHAYILDKDGKRLFQGGVSNSAMFPRADRKYLREALDDIKNGQVVRTPLARALGCAITRGDR